MTVTVTVGAGVAVSVGVGAGVTVQASDSEGEITARFSGEAAAATKYTEHHAGRTTSRAPTRSVQVPQGRQWKPVTLKPRLFTWEAYDIPLLQTGQSFMRVFTMQPC